METFPTPDITIAEIQDQLRHLNNSDLSAFNLSSDRSRLTLEATTGPQGIDYTIELISIIHLVFSQTPGDEEPYFVGEISVTRLSDGGKKSLSDLLYGFRAKNGDTVSFPAISLLHIRLEGAIYFEAICEHITISKKHLLQGTDHSKAVKSDVVGCFRA